MKTLDLSPSKAADELAALVRSCTKAGAASDDVRSAFCDSLPSFFEQLISGDPEFQWIWFDGVVARQVQVLDAAVEIEGLLYFVMGQKQTLVPLRVRLALDSTDRELRFRAYFVEEGAEPVSYGDGTKLHRVVVPQGDDCWRYGFEGVVPVGN